MSSIKKDETTLDLLTLPHILEMWTSDVLKSHCSEFLSPILSLLSPLNQTASRGAVCTTKDGEHTVVDPKQCVMDPDPTFQCSGSYWTIKKFQIRSRISH
jgi:hypothetical protein